MSFTIWIPGDPSTKGNYTPMRNSRTGKLFLKSSDKKLAPWSSMIKLVCAQHPDIKMIVSGPVHLALTWSLKRPKNHWKKDGKLKEWAAKEYPEPWTKPDVDKLERAVLDGLTGVLYRDDAQVTKVNKDKSYILAQGDQTGLWITIFT